MMRTMNTQMSLVVADSRLFRINSPHIRIDVSQWIEASKKKPLAFKFIGTLADQNSLKRFVARKVLKLTKLHDLPMLKLAVDSLIQSLDIYPKEDHHDMEVDTASSATQATVKHSPELEIYCYLLVLIFLIYQGKYIEAKTCSSASIACLKNLNRRTVDILSSRLYFYYSKL